MAKQRVMAPITMTGASRAQHAARILMANELREQYMEIHHNQFIEAGLDKYLIVNADDEVIGRADTSMAAQALITNADGTIRHEDFMVIRDKLVEVRRRKLNGIQDIMDAGLTFDESITTQIVGFENINEFKEAEQEMNPSTGSYDNNNTVYTEDFVPLPITHSTFDIPWRQQGFDYKRGSGLGESGRQVSERLENTLFNGNANIGVRFNGTVYTIFGYTTHPDRGTGTISDWTLLANNDKIVDELIDEIGEMWADQGGVGNDTVIVYVANDLWNVLSKDYRVGFPSDSHIDRMKEIPQVRDVKPAEKLASKNVLLVEMTDRSIEMAVATQLTAVPHDKTSPMSPQFWTTYAAMIHQIKVDSNSNTGIRHLTP